MMLDDPASPAERLRALELSGDPDAREIARAYKSSPLTNPMAPAMRNVVRSTASVSGALRPSFAQATEADADEAEEKVAAMRAKQEQAARQREEELHAYAKAEDRREVSMLRLTKASVVIALVSLVTSAWALVVAIVLGSG